MTEIAERLKNELAQLSPDEREEIAYYLLESLENDDPEFEAELNRRLAEFRSNPAVGIPAEEVLGKLQKKNS